MLLCLASVCRHVEAEAVTDETLRQVAAILGFTPSSLTVSGCGTSEVAIIVNALRGSPELQSVTSAQATLLAAESALAGALSGGDPLDPGYAGTIGQARSARDAAKTALSNAVAVAIARGTQDLTTTQRTRLTAWRDSPASLPPAFRVVAWTPAELKDVQSAVREERVALATQTEVSEEAAALLAQVRSRSDVADVAARLQSQLAAVTSAYLQATE